MKFKAGIINQLDNTKEKIAREWKEKRQVGWKIGGKEKNLGKGP